ncbi:proteasome activator complex subunit 3 [Moniliophthora roreri MCA 2997]|uniref:Proteasome activator complex subunit 3 n=1 Tax=Moniliophthora roreri (strain MCA 2997) TaxID=1381753 RepID=V2Z295_MONRO|nr:proteasome activator complex subunit 3 [Moniliophthora roreri MCA 2997]
MDKALAAELDKFQKDVAKNAEEIVFKTFPTKLIASTNDPKSPFHPSHVATSIDTRVYPPPAQPNEDEPPTKKRKSSEPSNRDSVTSHNDTQSARFENLVKSNFHAKSLHDVVKKECEEIATLIDHIKLWVTLRMPRIEDGDNFGVQVQEEALAELHRAQESAYNIRDVPRQDYLSRAKICSKLIKYPHVEDYTLALQEHDSKQIYYARQRLYDIRNLYAALTDVLHKNIAKIRAPKANNRTGMY